MSYKTEVLAFGETVFCSNGLRFATEQEAVDSGRELSGRWMMVKEYRAAESTDPVNYKFENGHNVSLG